MFVCKTHLKYFFKGGHHLSNKQRRKQRKIDSIGIGDPVKGVFSGSSQLQIGEDVQDSGGPSVKCCPTYLTRNTKT